MLGPALLGVVMLSACSGDGASLTTRDWIAIELNGQPPVALAPISASFGDDGRVHGVAGCNTYNGTYEVDGDEMSFGSLATTLMACPPPILDQEVTYLAALDTVQRYAVDGDMLTLYGSGERAIVVFVVEDQDLAGTTWDVISYNNGNEAVTSLITDTAITATFDEAGQLSGNASCNDYQGPYVADASAITIGPLAGTQAFCDVVMDQEAQYLAALESAAVYLVEAGRLELRTAENSLAVSMTRAGG